MKRENRRCIGRNYQRLKLQAVESANGWNGIGWYCIGWNCIGQSETQLYVGEWIYCHFNLLLLAGKKHLEFFWARYFSERIISPWQFQWYIKHFAQTGGIILEHMGWGMAQKRSKKCLSFFNQKFHKSLNTKGLRGWGPCRTGVSRW